MTASDPHDVARICAAADGAAAALRALGPAGRSELLHRMAAELEADGEELVGTADRETALGTDRLNGELTRTTGQLRLFADVLKEGSALEAVIDHADAAFSPPRPDTRRVQVPLGPVAVFGSSNFPLAFGVAGGDTASALAAGCPVVAKAHPSHPATSLTAFEAVSRAVARTGMPAGTVGLVWGLEAGRHLVLDPHVKAVGFTGSLTGGRHLHDLAAGRPEPIPFYGELSSLNPVFVTPGAARERATDIAEGFARSFSFGHGQVCTKPGLLLVPATDDGARLTEAVARAAASIAPGPLLNDGIRRMFQDNARRLLALPGVRLLAEGAEFGDERTVRPTLLATRAEQLLSGSTPLLEECFGPLALIATYQDADEMLAVAGALRGQLSTAVHAGNDETELGRELLERLSLVAGRIVWNDFTTGVAVGWATHHGGPYPATTAAGHTSVGAHAIKRFLRPVAYQSVPDRLLPEALRENNPLGLPRRIDGVAGNM